MNWDRVKTAFIILLAVCNLVLFYMYLDSDKNEEKLMTDENLEQKVSEIFEKNNIDISEIKDPNIKELPVLKLAEKELSFEKEKEKFVELGLSPYDAEKNSGYLYTYTFEGCFDINYCGDVSKIVAGDYNTAIERAKKVVNFENDDIKFEYSKYEKMPDGTFKIYFEQSYNGIRILDGYIIIEVKGDTIISLKEKALNLIEYEDRSQKLIPYSLALYKLYGEMDIDDVPTKITELNLVRELNTAYDDEGLISGETFAYYRFRTDSGKRYLVKAIDSSNNNK